MKHLAFLFVFCSCFASLWGELYVIAHRDVPDTAISLSELRNVYLGKKAQWSDSSAIRPARYRRGDVHREFLKGVLGKSPTQFRIYWKRAIFTGTRLPFTDLLEEEEMVRFVGETDGAIGYVSREPDAEDVKVLFSL